jgi:hypothetical protein
MGGARRFGYGWEFQPPGVMIPTIGWTLTLRRAKAHVEREYKKYLEERKSK